MKMLAHKSTTIVAYFPLMQPFISLALSIIFQEMLSLKLKAQRIIVHACLNSFITSPFLSIDWFPGTFSELAPASVQDINKCMTLFYNYKKRLNYNSDFSDKGTTVTNTSCRSSCSDKPWWVCPFARAKAKGEAKGNTVTVSFKLHVIFEITQFLIFFI